MKKGEVELKVASGSCGMNDYFIEQINGNPFTIFNLKDLRDLITEELEEEASNHTATCTALQENGMVNDLCCQPLTEGEGELSKTGHTLGAVIDCKKCEKSHVFEIMGVKQEAKECHCSRTSEFHHQDSTFKYHSYDICSINPLSKPQQESNKEGSKLDPWRKKYLVGTKEQAEELTRLGATDGVVHKFDEEEPSKKPSTRISEIRKNITSGGSFKVWYGNDSLTAIVEYLDELHERKVI